MDGQVVDADKSFKVPNPSGGFDMMKCPHDPKAPVEQIINCGCISLPWLKTWQVMTPGQSLSPSASCSSMAEKLHWTRLRKKRADARSK